MIGIGRCPRRRESAWIACGGRSQPLCTRQTLNEWSATILPASRGALVGVRVRLTAARAGPSGTQRSAGFGCGGCPSPPKGEAPNMEGRLIHFGEVRAEFLEVLRAFPAVRRNEILFGEWSLKDVVAHLVGVATLSLSPLLLIRLH